MLKSIAYDKIKLLHELSQIIWFIEKHAKNNAKNCNDTAYFDMLELMAQDLEKHINQLKEIVCK